MSRKVKKIMPPDLYSSSSCDEADTDIVAATAESEPDTVAPTAESGPDTVTPTAESGPDTVAPTAEPAWNQQPPVSSTTTSCPLYSPLTPFSSNNAIVIAIQVLAQQVSNMNITCDNWGKVAEANTGVLGNIQHELGRIETLMYAMTEHVQMHTDTPTSPPPHMTEETTTGLDDIPPQFAIGDDDLNVIKRESKNVGHFACNVTARVFPELFGSENLRFNYNWHGNGQLMKLELNPSKKNVVRKYVNYCYPETKSQESWNGIVLRINERLRRKDKVKKAGVTTQERPVDNVPVLSDVMQGSS